jgi:hypothetical protein
VGADDLFAFAVEDDAKGLPAGAAAIDLESQQLRIGSVECAGVVSLQIGVVAPAVDSSPNTAIGRAAVAMMSTGVS